jgi:putative redox protein
MHSIESKYLGNLRTESTHLLSKNTLITDAPPDNQGLGQAFSPTDLLCTSLSVCMLTLMGISARNHEIEIVGVQTNITKIMASNPRRVAEIKIRFYNFPVALNDRQKEILERAALTCPVAMSIHPDIIQDVSFEW